MERPHYKWIARLGQAISSPVRLRALNLLAQRPWNVGELANELGESLAATSAHLRVLRQACLVVDDKRGRTVWYSVQSDDVYGLLDAAQRTAEALLPEMREAAREAESDPFLIRDLPLVELADQAANDRVMLIDLRPLEEFQAGHLPGARACPYPQLAEFDLAYLQVDRPLIAYCRGPWCAMAFRGVREMNERGLPVRRLRAGIVQWRALGLGVEYSSPSPTPPHH